MMAKAIVAKKLKVNGIVQGVGFRPHVFQLAAQYQLKGTVANTSSGVSIHIEGSIDRVSSFTTDLSAKCPPLAHIVKITEKPQAVQHFSDFRIITSQSDLAISTLISPDVSICKDCLRELFDVHNRRYRYPFTNCTNCGPRYTIIDDIPYDRPKTSMRHFKMCTHCQTEYDNPNDRRFHAQPNACADCGPRVFLLDRHRQEIVAEDPIKAAARLLQEGSILAIKGLGGFHLCANAENSEAVVRLRRRKRREEKPLALMAKDVKRIKQFAEIDSEAESLLTSIQRPIVLVQKKQSHPIASEVSPRNQYFGVMLPYTPLHYLLLSEDFTALVMTSANLSEEPIAIDNDEAFKRLGDIADYFLIHNRDIYLRSDDSIVRHAAGASRYIRRSRGYVPIPVFLKHKLPSVLACGAELKNTICVTKNDKAFLSQHIGDLSNLATYDFFKLTIDHLKRILDITPTIIGYDMHPDYLSSQYAIAQNDVIKVPVQHHHAHVVSCMAEHQLEGPVIGLAFDGTGFGPDGTVWGGEILLSENHTFKRIGYLGPVTMPGSSAAIKEPWRMAVSYLQDAVGSNFQEWSVPGLKDIAPEKLTTVSTMITKQINAPLTSSLGRLFDGVAAILGIRSHVKFEGQAAMELEMLSDGRADGLYEFEWQKDQVFQVPPAPIIRGVLTDLQRGVSIAQIGAKFHYTLIRLFADVCVAIRKDSGLDRVVLSGGVFQNATLLSGLKRALEQHRFKVYTHEQVPCNDGGLALGQAVIAAAIQCQA